MTEKNSSIEREESHSLGLAGKIAQAFIHSPLSPLFFFAMLFMGVMGLTLTPRQEDPQISVPMVDIFIQYPGASGKQVASLAIDPLQRIMSEIPDVKHVYSASERGQGMVTVEFEVGQQLENSIFKVYDKLQSNMDKIPPGVKQPLVKPKGVDDVPVVTLTLWSDNLDDGGLRTVALEVMQSLKGIPNTGQSFVVGGRAEQVLIEVKPQVLSGFGISIGQVAQTIQTANNETSAGQIESGNTHFTVYTGRFLRNAEDVKELVVGAFQDAPVYVRDVANVTQGPEKEPYQIVNYYSGQAYEQHDSFWLAQETTVPEVNGAPAVTIAVSKKISTNGVSVARDILTHIDTLRKRQIIPGNVHVEVTRNYGQTANNKVNGLIKKLFIATGAVTILVLFSLGWRPSLVVTLVIPVVILITVFSAWILGYTIDRVSLFALIFSIGILVDDAIVVIENIYRRWLLHGETDTATAIDAVREVGNPTILATFTVVAALLPMGFVSGMMGPYMGPIPALGSVAMIFSLFAAFAFTPWLAMRFKPSIAVLEKTEIKEHKTNQRIEKFYRKLLPPLFTNRLLGWGFLLLLFFSFFAACSMFYFRSVEVKMLPLDKKPEFNVFIDMPEGTALPVT
ncbi:MAG: efflux RND transporter permease subunit, partial [Thiomargarita sp.]|nr:efflux RND transporter permease subunit [Thiomargarita sp.]